MGASIIGPPLLLGLAIFAAVGGLAAHGPVPWGWHLTVRLRRRARLRQRGAGPPPQ